MGDVPRRPARLGRARVIRLRARLHRQPQLRRVSRACRRRCLERGRRDPGDAGPGRGGRAVGAPQRSDAVGDRRCRDGARRDRALRRSGLDLRGQRAGAIRRRRHRPRGRCGRGAAREPPREDEAAGRAQSVPHAAVAGRGRRARQDAPQPADRRGPHHDCQQHDPQPPRFARCRAREPGAADDRDGPLDRGGEPSV